MSPESLAAYLAVLPPNVTSFQIGAGGAVSLEFGPPSPRQVTTITGAVMPAEPTEAEVNPRERMDPRLELIYERFPQMREMIEAEMTPS